MPDFVSGLFPDFTDGGEAKKAARKAALYGATYALGVSLALKFPTTTTKAVGIATGLELIPGKGFRLKPSALPVLMLPQPIGAVPPHYYMLPDIIGDPIEVIQIVRHGGLDALQARIDADAAVRQAEDINRAVTYAKGLSNDDLAQQVADNRNNGGKSLAAQEFTAVFTREAQRRGLIDFDPLFRPGVRVGPSGIPFKFDPGGFLVSPFELPVPTIETPTAYPTTSVTAPANVVEELRRLDRFNRDNPADP